jgi:hypothetical protein
VCIPAKVVDLPLWLLSLRKKMTVQAVPSELEFTCFFFEWEIALETQKKLASSVGRAYCCDYWYVHHFFNALSY